PADALGNAPATYGDVPKLGPPLPGDLGRPILESQREAVPAAAYAAGPGNDGALEAERERRRSASLAARSAGVIVPLAAGGAPAPPAPTTPNQADSANVPTDASS